MSRRVLGRHPSFVIGGVLTALVLATALVAFVWTPHHPARIAMARRLQGPSGAFWLGTDQFGRDVLSQIVPPPASLPPPRIRSSTPRTAL